MPFIRTLLVGILLVSADALAQAPPPAPAATTSVASDAAYKIELQQTRVRFESDGTGRRELALGIRVACDAEQRCFASVDYPARVTLDK